MSLEESGVRGLGGAEMVGLSGRQPRVPLMYNISRVRRTGAEAVREQEENTISQDEERVPEMTAEAQEDGAG